jgi:hypothetical protein
LGNPSFKLQQDSGSQPNTLRFEYSQVVGINAGSCPYKNKGAWWQDHAPFACQLCGYCQLFFSAAWAAASLAIGTRGAEQET